MTLSSFQTLESGSSGINTVVPLIANQPQKLKDAIAFHSNELLRLRGLLNEHASINRLPSELLSLIFRYQASAFQEENIIPFHRNRYEEPENSAHKHLYTWLNVSRVCRRWREVVHRCANFWRFLVIDQRIPVDALKNLLERTRGLPLTVVAHAISSDRHCRPCVPDVDIALDNYDTVLNFMRTYLNRISDLFFYVWDRKYDPVWRALSGSGALLTSLRIEAVGDVACHRANLHRPPIVIPNALFTEGLPPLRSLVFSGVGLSWVNVLFRPTLRHLEIVNCRVVGKGDSVADLGELLAVLRDFSAPYDTVALPSLELLRVPIVGPDGVALVAHLQVSHNAAIHFRELRSGVEFFDEETVFAFRNHLPRILRGVTVYAMKHRNANGIHGPPTLCQLSAKAQPVDETAGSDASQTGPSWQALSRTRPYLRFDGRLGSSLFDAIISTLNLQHLHLLSVSELSISHQWEEVFESAKNITTLSLQGQISFGVGAILARWKCPAGMKQDDEENGHLYCPVDHAGFADADIDEGLHSQGYASGAPLFPQLRTLRIVNADFPISLESGARTYHFTSRRRLWFHKGEPYGFDVPGLVKAVHIRAQRGVRSIERVEFERCQCWERERLLPLIEAVSEVWWDGRRVTTGDLGEQIERENSDARRPLRRKPVDGEFDDDDDFYTY
ncbi:hypothetical protein C8Q79DRAFT_369280 [Trametes meyenii]|nr:hypothetical protein C8Q79DRAFT_369280 [Trametes meyenii]